MDAPVGTVVGKVTNATFGPGHFADNHKDQEVQQ